MSTLDQAHHDLKALNAAFVDLKAQVVVLEALIAEHTLSIGKLNQMVLTNNLWLEAANQKLGAIHEGIFRIDAWLTER